MQEKINHIVQEEIQKEFASLMNKRGSKLDAEIQELIKKMKANLADEITNLVTNQLETDLEG